MFDFLDAHQKDNSFSYNYKLVIYAYFLMSLI